LLFNSIDFAIFCPVVFLLYWFVFNKSIWIQNFFIVVASLVFYGWWDWRFLSLLIVSALTDYLVGVGLFNTNDLTKRKLLLSISIFINIGLLAFFKYANFFLENFTMAYSFLGNPIDVDFLQIILPVGISFYTFQTLSYAIDVYRRKLNPTYDFISFLAFVSFFPQLVAGPIERATNLLPQFLHKRNFDNEKASNGLRQILWGLFKKIVVADNCAEFVNNVFVNHGPYGGSALIMAACLFSIQIYCDFSGYSDIAIGTAKLFGIDLMQNFNRPYSSKSFTEFWRRWHISLTTWFKDYVYIPLGGNRAGDVITLRNIFIVFLLSGLWHGPKWTFVVWALINAIYFILEFFIRKQNILKFIYKKQLRRIRQIAVFMAISFSWIFFRSNSLFEAFQFIEGIIQNTFFRQQDIMGVLKPLSLTALMILIEAIGNDYSHPLDRIRIFPRAVRWTLYLLLVGCVGFFSISQQQFIYFQF
jgi:alginate O-acetyltransferase complex protein AlgI